MGKHAGASLRWSIELPYDWGIPLLGIYPREVEGETGNEEMTAINAWEAINSVLEFRNRILKKKCTPGVIIVKFQMTKDNMKILKADRGKDNFKGIIYFLTTDLSIATVGTRQWDTFVNVPRRNKCHPRTKIQWIQLLL